MNDLSTSASKTSQLWSECPVIDGERQPTQDFLDYMDSFLFIGNIDEPLKDACILSSDGPGLWRCAIELSQSMGYEDEQGAHHELRLFAIPLAGPMNQMKTFVHTENQPLQISQVLHEWFSLSLSKEEAQENPLKLFLCTSLIHPSLIAQATPDEVRDLIHRMLLKDNLQENSIIQKQFQVDAESDEHNRHNESYGIRMLLCMVQATENQTYPANLKQFGVHEAALNMGDNENPRAEEHEKLWHILGQHMNLPPSLRMGMPNAFAPALSYCVKQMITMSWTIDLIDRGLTLNADNPPPYFYPWIKEVVVTEEPNDPSLVRVDAKSQTDGMAMVPIHLPITWAHAAGGEKLGPLIKEVWNAESAHENDASPQHIKLPKVRIH